MRLALALHPDCRCDAVSSIDVEVTQPTPGMLALDYVVTGAIGDLLLPSVTAPARADELWQRSCFEAFLRVPSDEAYQELNFSPSTQWAVYRFSGYRSGMRDAEVPSPRIETRSSANSFEMHVALAQIPAFPLRLALSAVIEETNGRKSYWALAHPAGKPDFHHPDSFVCELP